MGYLLELKIQPITSNSWGHFGLGGTEITVLFSVLKKHLLHFDTIIFSTTTLSVKQ